MAAWRNIPTNCGATASRACWILAALFLLHNVAWANPPRDDVAPLDGSPGKARLAMTVTPANFPQHTPAQMNAAFEQAAEKKIQSHGRDSLFEVLLKAHVQHRQPHHHAADDAAQTAEHRQQRHHQHQRDDSGRDQKVDRVDAKRRQRINLFVDFHRADFGGVSSTRTPGNNDRGHDCGNLPDHRHRNQVRGEYASAEQLQLHDKPVVIADIDGYWKPLVELIDNMIAENYARPENRELFRVVDRVEEVLPALEEMPEFRTEVEAKWM